MSDAEKEIDNSKEDKKIYNLGSITIPNYFPFKNKLEVNKEKLFSIVFPVEVELDREEN